MARIARAVAPGLPHHVTQRGNRRQQTFFNQGDYQAYLSPIDPSGCFSMVRQANILVKPSKVSLDLFDCAVTGR